MPITVRPAVTADIADMHRIRLSVRENRLTDPARVTLASYEPFVAAGDALVTVQGGEVLGFAALDAEAASIWALFVDPAAEGSGIGRSLLAALCTRARERGLGELRLTTAEGSRAQLFYSNAGWTDVGRAANGEIVFLLHLSAEP